eukprot:4665583-Pyramimonas_sp.AAC.1
MRAARGSRLLCSSSCACAHPVHFIDVAARLLSRRRRTPAPGPRPTGRAAAAPLLAQGDCGQRAQAIRTVVGAAPWSESEGRA